MMAWAHACRFTTLDDLPKRKHGDAVAVKAALLAAGRFSVFDVSTDKLGNTIEALADSGQIVLDNSRYPWVLVRTVSDAL